MNHDKFTSLVDSLAKSVNEDYKLDDSFYEWDATHEVCEVCDYSFVYGKAWGLVDFIRFSDRELFDQAECAVQDNDHNTDDINLNDYMLSYAFQILKISTLKKWEELQWEEMQLETTENV
tara:strand:- start:8 stop:367 length:360 start_codon:yes stop_codon:yes gene_type:complete